MQNHIRCMQGIWFLYFNPFLQCNGCRSGKPLWIYLSSIWMNLTWTIDPAIFWNTLSVQSKILALCTFSDPISLTHFMSNGLGTSFEHFYRLVPSVICTSHLSYFCMFFSMLTTECSILIAVYCWKLSYRAWNVGHPVCTRQVYN